MSHLFFILYQIREKILSGFELLSKFDKWNDYFILNSHEERGTVNTFYQNNNYKHIKQLVQGLRHTVNWTTNFMTCWAIQIIFVVQIYSCFMLLFIY